MALRRTFAIQRRRFLGLSGLVLAGATGCADHTVHQLLERAHDGDDMARAEVMALGERTAVSGYTAFALGQVYDPGLFPNGDAKRSAGFYGLARQGEPRAAHNLAVLVLTGQITEADAGIAPMSLLQLVVSAAERGVPESMVLAGEFYSLGVRSFPKNDVLATWWFERAVSVSGDAWARYRLGEAYLANKVRSRNQRFAYDLLASAAKAGVPEAAHLLAAVSADPAVALRWSLVSARMNGEDTRDVKGRAGTLSATEARRVSAEVAVWMSVHQGNWSTAPRLIRPVI
jgi:hypothetical protein